MSKSTSTPTSPADTLGRYAKAVVGFLAPGAVILGGAVVGASDGGSRITGPELVTALVAMIVTAAGVAAKSNAPVVEDDRGREEPLDAKPIDEPLA